MGQCEKGSLTWAIQTNLCRHMRYSWPPVEQTQTLLLSADINQSQVAVLLPTLPCINTAQAANTHCNCLTALQPLQLPLLSLTGWA